MNAMGLHPCPFCGQTEPDVDLAKSRDPHDKRCFWCIYCPSCEARGSLKLGLDTAGAAWNLAAKGAFDAESVRAMLRHRCDGNQAKWAGQNGVSAAYVSDVLKGRREPGEAILRALGIKRVVSFCPCDNEGEA